ncbi:MAG: type II secretion system F family protein [Actinobacteria bacterium]|nr:MAG: type II secretion system F family protein [Actinomycetota bacterium]
MILILILGLLLLAGAVALLVQGWRFSQGHTNETINQISAYGFSAERPVQAGSGPQPTGTVARIADRVGGFAPTPLLGGERSTTREQLIAAGLYNTSPRMVVGYRILLGVGLPLAWLWLAAATGFSFGFIVFGVIFLAIVGWLVPMLILNRRARERTDAIDYELPELIDLLVVTLEAGVSFIASLQMAAERLDGPLGVELRITLQEQRMGLTTNQALKGMLGRADTPGMRTFVRSVLQGETLGTSTGQIMRNLAIEMRKRRRSAAEERAQKAPIKILFPLVLLIFPAMFIVLLGPVAYSIGKIFGATG